MNKQVQKNFKWNEIKWWNIYMSAQFERLKAYLSNQWKILCQTASKTTKALLKKSLQNWPKPEFIVNCEQIKNELDMSYDWDRLDLFGHS